MIRYPLSDAALRKRIEQKKPGWTKAARARCQRLRDAGGYHEEWDPEETKVAWGDIKSVYRELQGHKCGYCERKLAASSTESPDIGGSEHDVEHYRPKASVTRWEDRKHAPAPQFEFRWLNEPRDGYYWLAFDPWNYCTACKVCNTELKGNRFPIEGEPGGPSLDRRALDKHERPLLLFPLGDIDDDPEDHITFTGVTATAVGRSHRGRATIEFFLLDRRGDLIAERTWALLVAWGWIAAELDATPETQEARREKTDTFARNPRLPHAGFIRSVVRLARADPSSARALHAAAMQDPTATAAVFGKQ